LARLAPQGAGSRAHSADSLVGRSVNAPGARGAATPGSARPGSAPPGGNFPNTTSIGDAAPAARGGGPHAGAPVAPGPVGAPVALDPARIVVRARADTELAAGGGPDGGHAALAADLLGDEMRRMIVTPKDVDILVETLANIVADGLNEA